MRTKHMSKKISPTKVEMFSIGLFIVILIGLLSVKFVIIGWGYELVPYANGYTVEPKFIEQNTVKFQLSKDINTIETYIFCGDINYDNSAPLYFLPNVHCYIENFVATTSEIHFNYRTGITMSGNATFKSITVDTK